MIYLWQFVMHANIQVNTVGKQSTVAGILKMPLSCMIPAAQCREDPCKCCKMIDTDFGWFGSSYPDFLKFPCFLALFSCISAKKSLQIFEKLVQILVCIILFSGVLCRALLATILCIIQSSTCCTWHDSSIRMWLHEALYMVIRFSKNLGRFASWTDSRVHQEYVITSKVYLTPESSACVMTHIAAIW